MLPDCPKWRSKKRTNCICTELFCYPDAGRPLADFLPTITIKAKDFATEITNFNVKRDDLEGEPRITDEHVKTNNEVRSLLAKSNIKPEELPPAEDVKKLKRRVDADSRKMLKASKKIQNR